MVLNIGGIASKLGNRYEAKWLVLRFLDVIGGQATWLRFEGVTGDFSGFEFAVHRMGRTEWHQTKLSAPNGNWTIGALSREGVLSAFKARLAADPDDVCVFVSQDPAKDLRELAAKAARANDSKEFDQLLANGERNKISQLEKVWESDRQTTVLWLRRCEVLSPDARTIDGATAAFSDLYFDRNSGAFAVLRDYLEENFNKPVTTENVRADLQSSGRLKLKHWSFDPTLIEKLTTETTGYLDTYPHSGPAVAISHARRCQSLRDLSRDPTGLLLFSSRAQQGPVNRASFAD